MLADRTSIRRKDLPMSPTYYAVQTAKFDADLDAARHAGDIPRLQAALAGLTSLNRAMYGHAAEARD